MFWLFLNILLDTGDYNPYNAPYHHAKTLRNVIKHKSSFKKGNREFKQKTFAQQCVSPQPFLHLTIIPSILCATAKRPIVWNFHQNSTGQMCQSQFVRSLGFGLINDLTIFLLSLNLEGPKKDCQDLKQANTFDVFFGKVHYWDFGIFNTCSIWHKLRMNMPTFAAYSSTPLPCPFQKQQSTRCWKQACLFLLPGQAAGHYGHPGRGVVVWTST